MKTIQNIVVAEPALASTHEVIAYAMALAHDLKAKLTIGLCYDYEKHGNQPTAFHEREEVGAAFRDIKTQCLKDTQLEYRLVSVDRLLCDEVEAPLDAYHPDLMIVATEHVEQVHMLIEQSTCPLILVPLKAEYHHQIKDLAVAYDAISPLAEEVIQVIQQLAMILNAKVHIVEIIQEDDIPALTLQEKRSNLELDFMLKNVRHQFHLLKGREVEKEIVSLVKELGIDLLVILARQNIPLDEKPSERHTVNIAQKLTIPLMVLKI